MGAKRDVGDLAVLLLAVVGALVLGGAVLAAALFGLLRLATIGEDDETSFVTLPSPDGVMKAILISSSGGGAMGGHCDRVVAVAPAAARKEDVARPEFQVFAARCASFSARDGAAASSPSVEWMSPERLKITFSTLAMRGELRAVRLRSLDASKSVTVEFAASD